MEYLKKSINGVAGEYLVAYKVTRLLGWPCRLYGVDLGIDAELELLSDNGQSTGDIIKIQIKAKDKIDTQDSTSIYLDDRHIDYWKRFCLPIIVCCVDLSTENVYWKQITSTEAYESGGESKKVGFCLKHDLLTENSREVLRKMVYPDVSDQMAKLFKQAQGMHQELPQGYTQYSSFDLIERDRVACTELQNVLNSIEKLISLAPWRVSTLALRELNGMRDAIRTRSIELNCATTDLANGG